MKPASLIETLKTLRRSHGRAQGNLTPSQLVERWEGAYSAGTLANWRAGNSEMRGPGFIKSQGRVLYPMASVEAFEQKLLAGGAP